MTRQRLMPLAAVLLVACGGSVRPPSEPAAVESSAASLPPSTAPSAAGSPSAVPSGRAVARTEAPSDTTDAREASADRTPAPAPKAAEPKVSDVPDATMTIAGMTVDGLSLREIACRQEGGGGLGGLFAGLTIGAGFKARKQALDACSPKGAAETRVHWTGAGGKMTAVRATSNDAAIGRCVERALRGAPATIAGECAATVRHGKH